MQIIGNTIIFKSDNENFQNEMSEAKPNTVRILDTNEEAIVRKELPNRICIQLAGGSDSFERELTNITKARIGKGDPAVEVWIFSWSWVY